MNRIKELRTAKKMKQSDLAALLNCAPTAVSKWELGENAIDSRLIVKLCDIFNVTADYLLCRTASPLAGITEEEYTVLMAYRRADDRTRCMVDLALEPFAAKKAASAG